MSKIILRNAPNVLERIRLLNHFPYMNTLYSVVFRSNLSSFLSLFFFFNVSTSIEGRTANIYELYALVFIGIFVQLLILFYYLVLFDEYLPFIQSGVGTINMYSQYKLS